MNWATSSNECFPLREVGGGQFPHVWARGAAEGLKP